MGKSAKDEAGRIIPVTITGIAPILQHRYVFKDEAQTKTTRKVGAVDYSEEWKKALYQREDGQIYEPANHLEGALIKAASNFQITGKGKKTYKDLFKSAVFVNPDAILYGKTAPDFIHKCLVRVNNSGVERLRPAFNEGWQLTFEITVLDDQIDDDVVHTVLSHAGRFVGIGDFRPRYGRFRVDSFNK